MTLMAMLCLFAAGGVLGSPEAPCDATDAACVAFEQDSETGDEALELLQLRTEKSGHETELAQHRAAAEKALAEISRAESHKFEAKADDLDPFAAGLSPADALAVIVAGAHLVGRRSQSAAFQTKCAARGLAFAAGDAEEHSEGPTTLDVHRRVKQASALSLAHPQPAQDKYPDFKSSFIQVASRCTRILFLEIGQPHHSRPLPLDKLRTEKSGHETELAQHRAAAEKALAEISRAESHKFEAKADDLGSFQCGASTVPEALAPIAAGAQWLGRRTRFAAVQTECAASRESVAWPFATGDSEEQSEGLTTLDVHRRVKQASA
eukprot:CAMPEP_0204246096 /NCGR_PEP_ID=MMETSP0361-20130328/97965_1 /ASSEMBLY_ACC=CAM_ASM_000343 /TAXON_ID=268821 /ORGANISM="Scrippsiella Hangoei, Strain SHTV-5" /LENGTH=321 /DNA_ID=CAMNT_0051219307 /DNA_START=117 /DNA_END=1083 /DNA_ORIENTATION=-